MAGSPSHKTVWAIYKDKGGDLYIGTDDGGLNVYHPNTDAFTHYQHNPEDSSSMGANEISVIFKDSKGILWIGTDGGSLDGLNPNTGSFTHYTPQFTGQNNLGPADLFIWDICPDNENNLWLGTSQEISVFDKQRKTFTHYQYNPFNPQSFLGSRVNCLYKDREGNLWIGSKGGLNLLHQGQHTFTSYRESDGLPNDFI